MSEYTNQWFDGTAKATWDVIIPAIKPQKILEVGSYEGRSICYLIEKLGNIQDLEIHAIDTWEGGHDHSGINMSEVERRFHANVKEAYDKVSQKIDVTIHKGYSDKELSSLISDDFENHFDLIYIDGSHQTPDVLSDAVLAFKLLKPNGVMIFDDYLWHEFTQDGYLKNSPKLAIDAFINIYFSRLKIICAPCSQMYIAKKPNG